MKKNQDLKQTLLAYLKQSNNPVSLSKISDFIDGMVTDRTLRRWLVNWVDEGVISKIGTTRSSQYIYVRNKIV